MKQRTIIWIALMGTTLMHASLFYALSMTDVHHLTSATKEITVMHIALLEDEKPTPEPVSMEPVKPIELPPTELPLKTKEKPKPIQKKVLKPKSEPISTPKPSVPSTPQVEEKPAPTVAPSHVTPSAPHSGEQDVLARYLAKVRKKIQENLQYPSSAKRIGLEGEATVEFVIAMDGMVDKKTLKILKSSRHRALDNNAMDAVLDALPFEAPPQENVNIVIPIVFNIKSL